MAKKGERLPPPAESGWTYHTDLARAVGISDSMLRKLVMDGQIDGPVDGWYETGKTLLQIIKHYRDKRTATGSKEELEEEKLIALRLRNERTKELLVSRAWVAAKIAALGGIVEDTRQRSILEDATAIAAFQGDVPATREALRKRWTAITQAIADLAEVLAQEPESPTETALRRGKA